MKRLAAIAILLVVLSAGLGRAYEEEFKWLEEHCIAIAENRISVFEEELDDALDDAIDREELDRIIENFSFDAQVISYSYKSGEFIKLRRVSAKARNKDNQANGYEIDVLNHFERFPNLASETTVIWNYYGTQLEFHYFKAIHMEADCLTCHGKKEQIPASIKQGLMKEYKKDRAFDYQDGDLRGLYIVTIIFPEDAKLLNDFLVSLE